MKARKKVVQGGTSAGKTYGIIPVLIQRATKTERLKITVIAETLPAVKEGAVDIFKMVMFDTGRWRESGWNASSLTYTFANGSRIQFKSFDSVGKAKSSGKRDILFINEANHIDERIADALIIRTTKEVWIDFNPDEEFWVHKEILKEPDSEFLLLAYQDNEACPPETISDLKNKMAKAFYDPAGNWEKESNIKSAYWANWCRVYIKGLVGTIEGTILSNWGQVNAVPANATLLGYGTDFGKGGEDPTTTIAVYWYDGEVYLDEVVWQSQLRDSEHIAALKKAGASIKVDMFCDNSEPTKIKELQLGGFKQAQGGKKETIDYGIGLLQEHRINITSRSLHLIEEFRNWKYDRKTGAPIDDFNHGIDAVRYFFVGKWGANVKKKISYKAKRR